MKRSTYVSYGTSSASTNASWDDDGGIQCTTTSERCVTATASGRMLLSRPKVLTNKICSPSNNNNKVTVDDDIPHLINCSKEEQSNKNNKRRDWC